MWQYHNFHNFFHNFHNSKAYILESYWRYHTRGSVWIDDDGSHCNSYKWPTLKNSFATEKTLALISEIFWNSEHFFILYCTVMSKIFILNLHMLVMHRYHMPSLSKRYQALLRHLVIQTKFICCFSSLCQTKMWQLEPPKIITNKTKWT